MAVGTGISGLIQRFTASPSTQRWVLLEPSYGLYERSCSEFHKQVICVQNLEDVRVLDACDNDILVITTPSWFDGSLLPLEAIEETVHGFSRTVLVDEGYVV